jgi:peptidoglycan hydrolase-like protein with peptidoglycan-binding domain
LKTGSIGKEVRLLQTLLKAQNVFPVTQAVTGFFGPVTRQAILDLQKKYNLPRVGEVGPRTRAILNGL